MLRSWFDSVIAYLAVLTVSKEEYVWKQRGNVLKSSLSSQLVGAKIKHDHETESLVFVLAFSWFDTHFCLVWTVTVVEHI